MVLWNVTGPSSSGAGSSPLASSILKVSISKGWSIVCGVGSNAHMVGPVWRRLRAENGTHRYT
jgi:hypothetical protein